MNEPRVFGLKESMILTALFCAALGVRSWYLLDRADAGRDSGPVAVQENQRGDYLDQVKNLRETGGVLGSAPLSDKIEPNTHTAPGYVYFLFLLDLIPLDLEMVARWAQCVLGGITVCLYFLVARQAFRRLDVAALAGVLTAFHPFWVVGTAEIAEGVLAAFFLGLCLWLGILSARTGAPFVSLLFGITLAGLAMVRASFLPFAFVAILWFFLRCRTLPRNWIAVSLALLGFINGLAPWTVRNVEVHRDLFPIVDSVYLHLWIGNNPQATGGPASKEHQQMALAAQKGVDPVDLMEELSAMDQPQRYDGLAPLVSEEIRANPGNTLQRRVWAGLCFWFGQDVLLNRSPQTEEEDGDWLSRSWNGISSGTLLAMFLPAILGWRWSQPWMHEARPLSLALAWGFLPFLLGHGESLHGPRFPLDGILLTLAAYAVVARIPGIGRQLFQGPTSHSEPEQR